MVFDPNRFSAPEPVGIQAQVQKCIETDRLGHLFRGVRPSLVMRSEGAQILLMDVVADLSVYERLLEIWEPANVGWSPAHERLAELLEVDWSKIRTLSRQRWVPPLSYQL